MRRWLYALMLTTLLAPGVTAPTVTVSERASVTGVQIVLGEIAAVQGTDEEAARLMRIVLAPAPIPGQRFSLTPAMIRVKLRQFGFDPDALTLTCPPAVEITRRAVTINGRALVAAADSWLRERLVAAIGEELVLTALSTPPDTATADGVVTILCAPAGSETSAQRTVQVMAHVDGAVAWRGAITFRLQRFMPVLVAQRAVAAHAILNAEDVALRRCEVTTRVGAALTDLAVLVGQRTSRALRVGDVLTADVIEVVPVVRRNQDVMVVAHCGEMVIRLRAVACQNGGLGATITVRNPQSHHEFSARVIGPGEVEVVW